MEGPIFKLCHCTNIAVVGAGLAGLLAAQGLKKVRYREPRRRFPVVDRKERLALDTTGWKFAYQNNETKTSRMGST